MSGEGLAEVLAQLQDYGLEPETPLKIGELVRCRSGAGRQKSKTGWYVVHEHYTEKGLTLYFGAYGDWRVGEPQKIKSKGVRLSDEEKKLLAARMAEAKRKQEERKARDARTASRRAAALFERLPEKGRCGYLERKQVVGLGVRYAPRKNAMLVPMRDASDRIVGLQAIFAERQAHLDDRDKTYWPKGMAKEGAFHLMGSHPEPGEVLLVCEGYATGASLHMATGLAVALAFDAGNLLAVAEIMRERFPGRGLIICADDDWKTTRPDKVTPYNPGREKAEAAATIVGAQVVWPIFSDEREDGWTDFNDLHCAEGLDAVRRQVMSLVRPPAAGGWKDYLQRTGNGQLIPHPINVTLILGNDERWKGVISEDLFSAKTVKRRATPYGGQAGEWSDLDDMRTSQWLASEYGLRIKTLSVLEGVSVVANDNRYHPVREYLEGLSWDGQPRLRTWLKDRLGGVPLVAPPGYVEAVGVRYLISAVARVMVPGAKADCVLILEGLQGKGKSTALKILGGEWYMDTPFPLGDKEAYQMIRGKWIIELGELDAFNKAESTKAKQFFSASFDTFRASYARRTVDVPRQCVFAGTTNQDEYLKDPTGNRRYWPVSCTFVDLEGLRADRDQLWAEAMHLYKLGEPWWPQEAELPWFVAEQDARHQADAWEFPILKWLETNPDKVVTTDTLLEKALNLDLGHWGKPEQTRVGQIMHRLGWRRERLPARTKSGIRPWGYARPADWMAAAAQPVQRESAF
ncbi:toprim domain-containing protein [Pseudomonas aeruginosa]|nr:toprim domain-containing protein [Pseudomonas aeruginosa]HCL3291055.1 toprim domain-containing protein [Pseudomonas aeruginosa]